MADDLVEGGVDEAVELNLRYRLETVQGQSDRDADDGRLRQRRVEHAIGPERLLQAIGNAKDAAEGADVLAKNQDLIIARQGVAEGEVDRFGQRDRFHQVPSSEASNSSRSSTNGSGGRS